MADSGTPLDAVCAPGLLSCGTDCVDTQTNPRHCGGCNNACTGDARCITGGCVPRPIECEAGFLRCNGACVDVRTDPRHCGGCNVTCGLDQSCENAHCASRPHPPLGGPNFKIRSLAVNRCITRAHNDLTGDDRGGLVVSRSGVFYTGDTRTAVFSPDFDVARPLDSRYDGLVSEFDTRLAGTLLSNRTPFTELTSIVDAVGTLDTLGPIDGVFPLSETLVLRRSDRTPTGVFSGRGRVIIVENTHAWNIDITDPTRLAVTPLDLPAPLGTNVRCESWAIWGVAEYFDGEPWVVFVRDRQTIVRQNLVTGTQQPVATFHDLGDMCSIAAAPWLNRWYFHFEGESQFGTGDETIGYCPATFEP